MYAGHTGDNIMEELFSNVLKQFEKKVSVNEFSPLALAYIGDSVYDVYVRTMIMAQGNKPVSKMHKEATHYVKASEQAKIYHNIENLLTEKEMAVFKRGRNAKSATMPKHAEVTDYRHATGLEALVGYLYLDGQIKRLMELLKAGIQERDEV